MTAINTYEMNARANKVDAIVEYLDAMAANANARSRRCVITAHDIVGMLRSWGEVQWAQVAQGAKVRVPSPVSRAAIIREYLKRTGAAS